MITPLLFLRCSLFIGFVVVVSGVLWTLVVLDREAARGYWLTVVVGDNGAAPLTDVCHVSKIYNNYVVNTIYFIMYWPQ